MPSQFYMVQRLLRLNTEYGESNLTRDSLATEREEKSLQKVMYNSAVLIGIVCAFTEQENTDKTPQPQACSLIKCLYSYSSNTSYVLTVLL